MRTTIVLLAVLTMGIAANGCAQKDDAHKHGEACGHGQAQAVKKETCSQTCTICLKCGELKGTEKCCNLEGREKCPECGLLKGSIGCCALPEGATEAKICCKCGEIKGSEKCCKTEGRQTCEKCGLLKGSPGCCNLKTGKCCGSTACNEKKKGAACKEQAAQGHDHGSHEGHNH